MCTYHFISRDGKVSWSWLPLLRVVSAYFGSLRHAYTTPALTNRSCRLSAGSDRQSQSHYLYASLSSFQLSFGKSGISYFICANRFHTIQHVVSSRDKTKTVSDWCGYISGFINIFNYAVIVTSAWFKWGANWLCESLWGPTSTLRLFKFYLFFFFFLHVFIFNFGIFFNCCKVND